nr:MAG TPA: hypothetical protein [Caudoviricetes sp.]
MRVNTLRVLAFLRFTAIFSGHGVSIAEKNSSVNYK